jgi:hypothetical protein
LRAAWDEKAGNALSAGKKDLFGDRFFGPSRRQETSWTTDIAFAVLAVRIESHLMFAGTLLFQLFRHSFATDIDFCHRRYAILRAGEGHLLLFRGEAP